MRGALLTARAPSALPVCAQPSSTLDPGKQGSGLSSKSEKSYRVRPQNPPRQRRTSVLHGSCRPPWRSADKAPIAEPSVLSPPTHHPEEGCPSRRLPRLPPPVSWVRASWPEASVLPRAGGLGPRATGPSFQVAGPLLTVSRLVQRQDPGNHTPSTQRGSQPGADGSALRLRQRRQPCPARQAPVSRHLHGRGGPVTLLKSH